jgi:hypothetical protein
MLEISFKLASISRCVSRIKLVCIQIVEFKKPVYAYCSQRSVLRSDNISRIVRSTAELCYFAEHLDLA